MLMIPYWACIRWSLPGAGWWSLPWAGWWVRRWFCVI
jgi:hypothetical protein